jgi:hypothetical protein
MITHKPSIIFLLISRHENREYRYLKRIDRKFNCFCMDYHRLVSAAIQLTNTAGGKQPTKGDNIQYIYTNSKHNNPLCRVVPLEILQKVGEKEKGGKEENGKTPNYYDKDKYREMILDAAETVLGYFGFDRTVYQNPCNNRKKKKWYDELQEDDIQAEMMMEKQ